MNSESQSDSTWENPTELELGTVLPPPFEFLYIREFIRRTDGGGWLYALGRVSELEDNKEAGQ